MVSCRKEQKGICDFVEQREDVRKSWADLLCGEGRVGRPTGPLPLYDSVSLGRCIWIVSQHSSAVSFPIDAQSEILLALVSSLECGIGWGII